MQRDGALISLWQHKRPNMFPDTHYHDEVFDV